jgi:malate dehydrogenase
MFMRKKVTFLGSGNVGATAAMQLAKLDFVDIVLIGGVHEGRTKGKALDMVEASAIERYQGKICGYTNDFTGTEGSDILVISAGIPRKQGMSRSDLLFTNRDIVRSMVEKAAPLSPNAVMILVTNPLDAMCHVALEASGFPKSRVMGMAGVLDSSRMATFIARELNVSVENVSALVLGSHGDSMVPLFNYTRVAGIPVTDLLSEQKLSEIDFRTRCCGIEIVELLKEGSAYYAPAYSINEMIDAIMKDKKKIMPCSAYLEGEYGMRDVFIGVPVKLGSNGIEEIIELKLTESEKEALRKSADSVKDLVKAMKK